MPHPLSPVDAAWLRMDSPTNQMVITTVFRFDAPLENAAVDATIARLVEHPRFRQRPVRAAREWTRLAWEEDPAFDLGRHVEKTELSPPADDAALEALVSARMSEPLDRAHPLWRVVVVNRLGADGRGSALVVRVHHAVGDGVTLVRLLLGVSRASADRAPVEVGVRRPPRPRTVRAAAERGASGAATLARLLLLPADHATPLRGTLGTRKVAAMSAPIPLATVKALAKRSGGSVNDLLCAAIAGAVRAYLGTPPEVRAMVPVFFRSDESGRGGNNFGLVYLPLPVDEPERLRRVRLVKQAMDAIKSAPDAAVAFLVLGGMGMVSPSLERVGIDLFTRKATMLITNVPGPAGAVEVAGQSVKSMVVWAPTSGSIGLGFSLLTYAGELRLGVAADAQLVGDPRALVTWFEREMRELEAALCTPGAKDRDGCAPV